MHPVLARKGRLGLYLLAWIPPAGILYAVLSAAASLGRLETAAVVAPLALAAAFLSLSTWYLCRVFPLRSPRVASLLAAHLAAALVSGALWVFLARAISAAYAPLFAGLEERLAPQRPLVFAIGVLVSLLAAAMHYVLLAMEASRDAEAREMAVRITARDAELRALKAQVNPHFLFNSLHSISALAGSDPARARQMCVLLSDFLRSTLGLGEKASIPLAEELSLVRSYLAVESVRFSGKLTVQEEIEPDCEACPVPPLVLQPLVENAVRHGIANLLEGGLIRLEARRSARTLRLTVENTFDPEAPPRRSTGRGLRNVQDRLRAHYGNEARLEAGARGDCYRAQMLLPVGGEEP